MAVGSNSFGQIFRITTWGESHGKAIGVVIDGCPAGLPISEQEIGEELERRAPGRSALSSPRCEPDVPQILSGVFEGVTSGTPISIIIYNRDVDSSKYEPIKGHLRPGHANYTYLEKYGVFDYRGGGRASARETAVRVAAGAVAKKLLGMYGVEVRSQVVEVGGKCEGFEQTILEAKERGDSVGGVAEVEVVGLPSGLGEPIYHKMEAMLAGAMLSIPASKGFEIGKGFEAAKMCGSEHNDLFVKQGDDVQTWTNHAGGTLGGITTGMPLVFRVPFKPTSSVKKAVQTVTTTGETATYELPKGSRHDPCLVYRVLPVVEAMSALVLADCMLLNRTRRV